MMKNRTLALILFTLISCGGGGGGGSSSPPVISQTHDFHSDDGRECFEQISRKSATSEHDGF